MRDIEYDEASPLNWPTLQPRIESYKRQEAAFRMGKGGYARMKVDFDEARRRALRELELLGAKDILISRNAGSKKDSDPGVAVYFHLAKQRRVLACDHWTRQADNLAAIAAHVEAMRGIERWGVGTLEQAFAGYAALPAVGAERPWWEVLGVPRTASRDAIEARYHHLAAIHHPDRGGNPEQMAEVNAAYEASQGTPS